MIIYPAIDIIDNKAVRLFKGEYEKKTEYGDPVFFAEKFKKEGATHIHVVDLDGAKAGRAINFKTVAEIKKRTGLFVETGGGVRDLDTLENYFNAGIDRVIIGTSAVLDEGFLKRAVDDFGKKIAVGADVKNGLVAVRGWTETCGEDVFSFFEKMIKAGVETIVCTDVSKDGALQGVNAELYAALTEKFGVSIIASGGVTDLSDIKRLKETGVCGAIVGKAYYSGRILLKEAIEVAK